MKWIAKIKEYDDSFGDEILMAIVGGEAGFEVIMSSGEDSDVFPGDTYEEARENLKDCYGYYDTFRWLDGEESE